VILRTRRLFSVLIAISVRAFQILVWSLVSFQVRLTQLFLIVCIYKPHSRQITDTQTNILF